ncbi:MAG: DNA-binding response regulator [Ahrensia sp.]|jgi:two-component system OmpR family response regulator|nr:DNA-binding response regulator [Ahrensia sp.]
MRILVVEDEPRMARLLRRALTEEGYAADIAADGVAGLDAATGGGYDAIVLDVMLPKLDGFTVCRTLRAQGDDVPILMLTARGQVRDRVAGLDGGADDYLTKPFHLAEFFARLRALLRRGHPKPAAPLCAGDLRLDPVTHRVWRGEAEIEVTAKEFALLETFLRHPGAVFTRQQLLEHCWDFAFESRSNVVEVHIRALRDKIDRRFGVTSLETLRGVGYRLNPVTLDPPDGPP